MSIINENSQSRPRLSTLRTTRTRQNTGFSEYNSFKSSGDIFKDAADNRSIANIQNVFKRQNSNDSFYSCQDEDQINQERLKEFDDLNYLSKPLIDSSGSKKNMAMYRDSFQDEQAIVPNTIQDKNFSDINGISSFTSNNTAINNNQEKHQSMSDLHDSPLLVISQPNIKSDKNTKSPGGGGERDQEDQSLQLTEIKAIINDMEKTESEKGDEEYEFPVNNEQSSKKSTNSENQNTNNKNKQYFQYKPSFPDLNFNNPNNQPHQFWDTLDPSRKNLKNSMNRLISVKNKQQIMHFQQQQLHHKRFTLNFIAILYQQLNGKTKDSINTIIITKTFFIFSLIIRFYLYIYIVIFCISFPKYTQIFIPLIILARSLYSLSLMNVLFFYDEHTNSFKKVASIFHEGLQQDDLFDQDNQINIPTSKKVRLTKLKNIQKQVFFALTPPELSFLFFTGKEKTIFNVYMISNMILQGIQSIVFWPVLVGLLFDEIIHQKTEFDEEIYIDYVSLFLLLIGIIFMLFFSLSYIFQYNEKQYNTARRMQDIMNQQMK